MVSYGSSARPLPAVSTGRICTRTMSSGDSTGEMVGFGIRSLSSLRTVKGSPFLRTLTPCGKAQADNSIAQQRAAARPAGRNGRGRLVEDWERGGREAGRIMIGSRAQE